MPMIDRLLAECGSSKEHLRRVRIFLADISEITRLNAVRDAWVAPGQTPPRVTAQARLADPRWRIEAMVARQIAALGSSVGNQALQRPCIRRKMSECTH